MKTASVLLSAFLIRQAKGEIRHHSYGEIANYTSRLPITSRTTSAAIGKLQVKIIFRLVPTLAVLLRESEFIIV
jgi:hypothetical protein